MIAFFPNIYGCLLILLSFLTTVFVNPAIDPFTITSWTPPQLSAYSAESRDYFASVNAGPEWESLKDEFATNSRAKARASVIVFIYGSGDFGSWSSLMSAVDIAINSLAPESPAGASFYDSVISHDMALASSVVNNVDLAPVTMTATQTAVKTTTALSNPSIPSSKAALPVPATTSTVSASPTTSTNIPTTENMKNNAPTSTLMVPAIGLTALAIAFGLSVLLLI